MNQEKFIECMEYIKTNMYYLFQICCAKYYKI